ncbi:MAG: hypothetical protein ABI336_04205 [Humibacillus sp.]
MSTTPLLDRLVDDAAVFPPGLAPLESAVREHLARRTSRYAVHLGPLLVPAAAAAEVAVLAAEDERTQTDPLRVGLVCRPGSPEAQLVEAVAGLRDDDRVVVAGVEVGWSPTWRSVLELGTTVAVEVGLGHDQSRGLDEIASAVDEDADVVAKFRTGATPTWSWPDEAALAGFIDAAVLRGLPVKLTGGLHHVTRASAEAEPAHGLLNVLLAVHEALDGAEAPELAALLGVTDTEKLMERVAALTAVDASRLRRTFRGFGCCGVIEPLSELEALGLIGPPQARS